MSKRREFSGQFKAKVVMELLSNTKSSAEVCREYQLSSQLLGQWKATFVERAAQVFGDENKQQVENSQISELERLVGRLTLENDILKKATNSLSQPLSRNGRL